MGLRELLFGTSGSDEDSGRPPKPDVEQDTKRLERTRYEATVEYRNGDVETFECYGIYSRGDTVVKFNTDPYGKASWYGDNEAGHSYRRRKINYETLAREPELEELATDTFLLSFTREWEWSTGGAAYHRASYDWHETHEDVELTVQRDTGINTDESE